VALRERVGLTALATGAAWETTMDIDQLIAMDDGDVRKQVGECFRAQLRSHPAVGPTLFPGAPAANPAPPAELRDFVGEVATALVAWSISSISSYGFNRTADAAKARTYVTDTLNWGSEEFAFRTTSSAGTQTDRDRAMLSFQKAQKVIDDQSKFKKLASFNYDALFPQYCAKDGVTFQQYLAKPNDWGPALADTLASDAFIVTRALSNTADPSNFYQGLYLLLYKLYRLAPSRLDAVISAWVAHKLAEVAEPRPPGYRFVPPIEKLRYGWTNYERMQAAFFSENTYLSDIQDAVARGTETDRRTKTRSHPVSPGGSTFNYPSYTEVDVAYGKNVAEWLSQRRGKYDFLTGEGPSNTTTQEA
jgi:hypothetical protein